VLDKTLLILIILVYELENFQNDVLSIPIRQKPRTQNPENESGFFSVIKSNQINKHHFYYDFFLVYLMCTYLDSNNYNNIVIFYAERQNYID